MLINFQASVRSGWAVLGGSGWESRGRSGPAVLRASARKWLKDGNSPLGQKNPCCSASPATSTRGCPGNPREPRQGARETFSDGQVPRRASRQRLCRRRSGSCLHGASPGPSWRTQPWEPSASGVLQRGQGTPRKLRRRLGPGRGRGGYCQPPRPASPPGFPPSWPISPIRGLKWEAAKQGSCLARASATPAILDQLSNSPSRPLPQTRNSFRVLGGSLPSTATDGRLGDDWGSAPAPTLFRPVTCCALPHQSQQQQQQQRWRRRAPVPHTPGTLRPPDRQPHALPQGAGPGGVRLQLWGRGLVPTPAAVRP